MAVDQVREQKHVRVSRKSHAVRKMNILHACTSEACTRVEPQQLLEKRIEVWKLLELAKSQLIGAPRLDGCRLQLRVQVVCHLGVLGEQVHSPSERGGGGVVAGKQEGLDVVADLRLRQERLACVVGGQQGSKQVELLLPAILTLLAGSLRAVAHDALHGAVQLSERGVVLAVRLGGQPAGAGELTCPHGQRRDHRLERGVHSPLRQPVEVATERHLAQDVQRGLEHALEHVHAHAPLRLPPPAGLDVRKVSVLHELRGGARRELERLQLEARLRRPPLPGVLGSLGGQHPVANQRRHQRVHLALHQPARLEVSLHELLHQPGVVDGEVGARERQQGMEHPQRVRVREVSC
mmetsp:Transcript_7169/g.13375  ORF Transcript_7169/g.13375 Transcript_7169/m.13375 type:complete len:351 (-) Transcript_7169:306-1358(-)